MIFYPFNNKKIQVMNRSMLLKSLCYPTNDCPCLIKLTRFTSEASAYLEKSKKCWLPSRTQLWRRRRKKKRKNLKILVYGSKIVLLENNLRFFFIYRHCKYLKSFGHLLSGVAQLKITDTNFRQTKIFNHYFTESYAKKYGLEN